MVIFINGSFGIGKTTVARLLVRQLPRSVLFDPEPVGLILSRLRAPWPARRATFQDLSAWRTTSITAHSSAAPAARHGVVAMAFSKPLPDQFRDERSLAAADGFRACSSALCTRRRAA